ncbi:twin-arginine translocase subunit TatB [Rhodospirillaceae bacterium KN72]|uniref:Sec-independent protein translocase protein TatB n=1 Tax=Pacificispira spongiicola TaxID=2729598 RepID=A0A7Y0DYS1_9PROT|nr:Sec-independent protein translocase protein TatB [Pacificispira spongiicola]NMM44089.1 twin-arginine translocase subunit TatB [Pacificispira spongiicola]
MLDFGWQEFMVIAVVTVLVVGPKELPRVFRTITGVMRKARSMANEFHSAMDEMAREADLEDVKKEFNKVKNGSSDWVKDIDPTGEIDKSVKEMKDEVDSARKIANAPSAMNPTASYPAKSDTAKPADTKADEKPAPTGGAGAEKAAAEKTVSKAAVKKAATKTATKKAAAKKVATKTAAKKTATTKATAKKTAAKKAAVKKATVKTAEAKPSPSPSATTPAPQIKSEPKDNDA